MIYVSSACVKDAKIGSAVDRLAEAGFQNIELSGGTKFYEGYEEDLFELEAKHDLNYLVHNYFPPPKEDFVLNLASANREIRHQSLGQLNKSLEVSRKLGAKKFGFHAGLFFDLDPNEVGRRASFQELKSVLEATERFREGFTHLEQKAAGIELYVENHVLSSENYETFGRRSPLMLIDYKDYRELRSRMKFKLLLDVAHLKVSANSLGLSFLDQLEKMMPHSDYIHISDNDGVADQNRGFYKDSELFDTLGQFDFRGKLISLEVYDGIESVQASFEAVRELADH